MLKLILFFLLAISTLFSLPNTAIAANQGKIGLGPIWLRTPDNYDKGVFIRVTLTGEDINNQQFRYVKLYEYRGGCGFLGGADTCIDSKQIPDGNDVNGQTPPALGATKDYTVSITVDHISNGQTDPTGTMTCVQNCGAVSYANQSGSSIQSQWTKKTTQDIGASIYQWSPAPLTTPEISLDKDQILPNESINAVAKNLDYRVKYYIFVQKKDSGSNTPTFYKETGLTINDQRTGCNFQKNELQITCTTASDPTVYSIVDGRFTILGSMFPIFPNDENYTLFVRMVDKSNGNLIRELTRTILIKTTAPASQTLNVDLAPSEVETNKDERIVIKVSSAQAGKKYNIEIKTSTNPLMFRDIESASTSFEAAFNTKQNNNFLFTGAGDYIIIVSEQGSANRGQASLKVKPGSTPTPITQSSPAQSKPCDPKNPECTSSAGISCDPDDVKLGSDGKPTKTGEGIWTAIGCVPTNPTKFTQGVIKLIMGAGGGIALLLMAAGAFQMMASAGNPDNLKKGQEQLTSAIIGLLFVIFSVLLLEIIGVDILGITLLGR